MFGGGIYYLIYSGQGKTILWADVIQVSVINTNLPFSSIFGTTTTFANQSGYSTSLINPAASNLPIFSLNDILSI